MSGAATLRRGVARLARVVLIAVSVAPSVGHTCPDDVKISDQKMAVAFPSASAGAVYVTVTNNGEQSVRLVGATTDAARKAELHTHIADANGVMRMQEVSEGFEVAASQILELKPGGLHLMLMGLTRSLSDGEPINLSLHFSGCGTIEIEVPVEVGPQGFDTHTEN